tara:strand:+ start:2912 stop:3691 length:780 start_codon:yes stop_codon:yes gene_type:complete
MVDIDPRIQERRIEIIRAKGKRRLRMLLMAVLLVLLLLAAVLISKSSLLDVDEVVVVGVDSQLEELIVTVANIPKSKPLLEIDTQAISTRIKKIPSVRDAKVSRSFGGKVTISVMLREPSVLLSNLGQWFLIDLDGRVLERVPELPPNLEYPIVEGNFDNLKVGEWVPDQALFAIELAANLPPVLLADISFVSLSEGIELILFGEGKILFGDDKALESKILAASTILDQVDLAELIHIDVRTPDKPVLCRSSECSYDSY